MLIDNFITASQYSLRAQNKPRPLAEGVGEGSQRLYEGVCAKGLSRAKFNKDEKIRKADFYLNYSLFIKTPRNDLTTTSLQSGSG
ncbi:MAG: hypothetical protein IIV15_02720, partial [Ruminococcus sp.]|nr:hypothetical protein [Ruminococcus sp.]